MSSQSSVLAPVLFVAYIDNIDIGITDFVINLTRDMKIGNLVFQHQEREILQHYFIQFLIYILMNRRCIFDEQEMQFYKKKILETPCAILTDERYNKLWHKAQLRKVCT